MSPVNLAATASTSKVCAHGDRVHAESGRLRANRGGETVAVAPDDGAPSHLRLPQRPPPPPRRSPPARLRATSRRQRVKGEGHVRNHGPRVRSAPRHVGEGLAIVGRQGSPTAEVLCANPPVPSLNWMSPEPVPPGSRCR